MSRLVWTTKQYSHVGGYRLPIAKIEDTSSRFQPALRTGSREGQRARAILWPLVRARDGLLIDGFVEWQIGRWIRQTADSRCTFLEIGCGDMSLQRYLPRGTWYNAFDVSLLDFHLRRVLRRSNRVNVALASVTDIPLGDSVASVLVSSQVLEYVVSIDRALDEIYRVSTPRAKLIVSIANGHCRKYQRKGPHRGHVNFWSSRDFIEAMATHNFKPLEVGMRGLWIPLPAKLTATSYEVPISSGDEYLNSYLFFVFEASK